MKKILAIVLSLFILTLVGCSKSDNNLSENKMNFDETLSVSDKDEISSEIKTSSDNNSDIKITDKTSNDENSKDNEVVSDAIPPYDSDSSENTSSKENVSSEKVESNDSSESSSTNSTSSKANKTESDTSGKKESVESNNSSNEKESSSKNSTSIKENNSSKVSSSTSSKNNSTESSKKETTSSKENSLKDKDIKENSSTSSKKTDTSSSITSSSKYKTIQLFKKTTYYGFSGYFTDDDNLMHVDLEKYNIKSKDGKRGIYPTEYHDVSTGKVIYFACSGEVIAQQIMGYIDYGNGRGRVPVKTTK